MDRGYTLWDIRDTLQLPHQDIFHVVLFLIFTFLIFFWGRVAKVEDRYKGIENWGALYKTKNQKKFQGAEEWPFL